MNILFVCSRNRRRSPTAEQVYAGRPGLFVMSAGTAPDAEVVVSADLVEWADVIFAMEPVHRTRLNRDFSALLKNKRVVVLGIRDRYPFMDSRLVTLLESKVGPHVR